MKLYKNSKMIHLIDLLCFELYCDACEFALNANRSIYEKIIFEKVKFLAFLMRSIAKNQHDSYFLVEPEILGIQEHFLAVGKPSYVIRCNCL